MPNIEILAGSTTDSVEITGAYEGMTRCACFVRRRSKMNFICTGNGDGSIAIRSEDAEKCIPLENDHLACVNCVAIDSSAIWVGCNNGLLNIYDIQTGALRCRRKESSGGVLCIMYNPIVNQIFTGGHGWKILRWNCASHCIAGGASLSGHTNAVRSLATETHYLYSSSDDSTVRCWNVGNRSGALVWTAVLGTQRARCIVLAGDHLVCSIAEGGIQILSKCDGSHLRHIDIGPNTPGAIIKDIDDDGMWVADSSGAVTVWDRDFIAKQIVITSDKRTLVSSMVPLSHEFDIHFFARQEGLADSLSTLVGMQVGAPSSGESCRVPIVDTCRRFFRTGAVLAELREANASLDAIVVDKWGKLSGFLKKQAMVRVLHVFYQQILKFSRKRTAYLEKIMCLYKNSLQKRRLELYYSMFRRNVQFRRLNMGPVVQERISRKQQVFRWYRRIYELSKRQAIPVE